MIRENNELLSKRHLNWWGILSGTDKFINFMFLNEIMKIREVLDKKVGNTKYTRYITTLPKDVVKESKLLGKELKARVEKNRIILEQS